MTDLERAIKSLQAAEVEMFRIAWLALEERFKHELGAVPIAVDEAIQLVLKSVRELCLD